MKTKIAMALIINACVVSPTIAGDIYRWTDPETGKVVTTPSLPPYPVKEKRPAGGLPNGELVNVILDAGSPEVKAAIEKRKAKEAEEKRIFEERQAKEAEQKRIAEEKAKEQAQKNNKENNTFSSKEPICIGPGCPGSGVRLATEQEIADCLTLIKKKVLYKDPASVRVEDDVTVAKLPDGRQQISMAINAKNSYGAYIGAKPAYCTYRSDGSIDSVDVY